jgi:twitching motility two-component system response regulator PilH
MVTRMFIKGMLESFYFELLEAVDGEDGLAKIDELSPDLIFMDILMPKKDGTDVLRELKEKSNDIPVVILSADIQQPTKDLCFSLGASAFLHKPVNENEIKETVVKLLNLAS